MKSNDGRYPSRWIYVTPESMVEDYDHYKYFMDHFGSIMVGRNNFLCIRNKKQPDEWLSTAGEAFALMMIDNYLTRAIEEAGEGKMKMEEEDHKGNIVKKSGVTRRKGRWTIVGSSKNWIDKDGMARYEDLYDRIFEARKRKSRRENSKRYWRSKMPCKARSTPFQETPQRIKGETQILDF